MKRQVEIYFEGAGSQDEGKPPYAEPDEEDIQFINSRYENVRAVSEKIDELLNIGHNYNGGSRASNNRRAHKFFNDRLKAAGGKRMDRLVNYFSSTEADERNAYTSHMNIEPPYVVEIQKYGKFLVRAVHAF